jgi:hypothetical protein
MCFNKLQTRQTLYGDPQEVEIELLRLSTEGAKAHLADGTPEEAGEFGSTHAGLRSASNPHSRCRCGQ